MADYGRYEQEVLRYFGKLPDGAFERAYCLFCSTEEKRSLMFTKGTMVVVRCKCGFVYNAHQASPGVLDDFYKRSEAMQSWADLKTTDLEDKRQKEKFGSAVEYISSQLAINSVLDIGCGTGKFLALVKNQRPDLHVLGTDTHEASLAVAKKQGIQTENVSIDELLSRTLAYDCITLWGVLEHVKNPLRTLRLATKSLKPYGTLIVCVPNVSSEVVRSLWDKCFTFCPQHLWYFNRDTLIRCFELSKLTTIRTETIEAEAAPIIRRDYGFPPYDDRNDWNIPKLGIANLIGEKILKKDGGYKIVAYAQKLPELGDRQVA